MSIIPRLEHPRPDRMRDEWLSLNGEWDFEIDNAELGVFKEYFKRQTLDGKIIVPFCPESKLSGVNHTDFINAVWYRRDIEIPKAWAGKRIILHIDACDYESTVYVNGVKVGSHKGGYTPFAFDITDNLNKTGNYITVHAADHLREERQVSGKQSRALNSHGCYYTRTTGIWQSVWLEACPGAHTVSYRAYPNISAPGVSLAVVTSAASIGAELEVVARFQDREVGRASTKIASLSTELYIPLAEKHLWECGCGNLYDLTFTIKGKETVDVMNGYFGLREVSLTKNGGFKLNGKTVFGRFVLDQGFYPDGIYTAPTDEALVFDIEASMSCGFNGARLHQKVFEPRFLYHADCLGYMVWAEAGNWGLDTAIAENIYNFLPEWLEEIERDFSHPSVIGWCPFNETWDANGIRQCNAFLDMVYDVTKAIDKTRPTITDSGSYPTDRSDVHDIHDYEQDPEKFRSIFEEMDNGIIRDQLYRESPDRQRYNTALPVFVSEYGGIRWVLEERNDGAWGYGKSVEGEDEFFARLEGLTDAILDNERIFAYCYTQLTDVEQEQNGLMTYDRRFKFAPERFKRIFGKSAAIEKH